MAAQLNPPDDALMLRLEDVLGEDGVIRDPMILDRYNADPYGGLSGGACILVRPRDTRDVAAVVGICASGRVGLVVRGGGTGFLGGARAHGDGSEILMSLERMDAIRDIDLDNSAITVEAGCVLSDIQAAAEAQNRLLPLSLGAEASCQIGGNLATNAGGFQVLRYGNARDLCLGLEVVLPDGRILASLRGLRKDNAGYDLRNLFIGSEGTLGIITAAVLKLYPRSASMACAMAATPTLEAATRLLALLQERSDSSVSCFEFISGGTLTLVGEVFLHIRLPFPQPLGPIVLSEIGTSRKDASDIMVKGLDEALQAGLITDAVIASSETQRRSLWRIREAVPEMIGQLGWLVAHDVSVPISRVGELVHELERGFALRAPSRRFCVYGHLGDGNLHVSVLRHVGATAEPTNGEAADLSEFILSLVVSKGGSISAEHGIGEDKASDLQRYASREELDLMRGLKQLLDPIGIMNPRKVLMNPRKILP
jgi:FAD/FMN-containing dehydrogenase